MVYFRRENCSTSTADSVWYQFGFYACPRFDVIKELDDVDADGDGAASFVGTTMTAKILPIAYR